ncbi:MAG TPA: peptidase M6 [Actinomycetota bacterium]|nr:peptidase M6 [Actinomycetota bacterium]
MRRRALSVLCTFGLLAVAVPIARVQAEAARVPQVKVRHVGPDYNGGRMLPIRGGFDATGAIAAAAGPKVGTKREWLGLDDIAGRLYPKDYTLRGKGEHLEAWVANDIDETSTGLNFPGTDCRNDERVLITNKQVKYLINQFDKVMFPRESKIFSTPPKRDGSDALLYDPSVTSPDPAKPRGYYKGRGDRVVVLIDNVRDDNFYDTDNSENLPYIAGFFFSGYNELFDRNVMTIDAYDWIHRTHKNPLHEPVPGDNCASKPARPFLYEGTFAHEYQHLLEYYRDPDEAPWTNEGLSDLAQTVTGYVDPRTPITESGYDGHIQAFLGWLEVQTDANPNPRAGGPENSLNLWEEPQQPGEVLSDYGGAYTFFEMLKHRYGGRFIRKVHRHPLNGLESLDTLLQDTKAKKSARQVLHEWSAMVALDGVLDDGATLTGAAPGVFKTKTLDSSINWDNDDTFSYPGAPPNGSDFVRLRDGDGAYVNSSAIESISFDGSDSLPAVPIEWEVDQDPPDHNNAALYSGSGASFDRAIVEEVNVPAQDPQLTFETRYEVEEGWDYGFVQVSDDGGESWTSLENDNTIFDSDPGAIDLVKDNLPGFTGNSGCEPGSQLGGDCTATWVTETFDLSDYAGEDILLSFRNITDPGVNLPGWWIDEIRVGNKNVSNGTSINEWQTPTEINPHAVEGFTLQLIAYNDAHTLAGYTAVPLGSGFTAELDEADLAFLPDSAETVAALVMYDESTEQILQYAPYSLQVNGVTQPGGG